MTLYPLLAMNATTSLLNTNKDLMGPQKKIRNITKDINNRIFIQIPKKGRVRHRHICIVGKQDCGKTQTSNMIVYELIQFYGWENVNITFTDDPRITLELFNDKPVQICVIDDATSNASSREIHKQTQLLKAYNKSRHIYEDMFPGKPSILIFIFGWQRWKELDPGFRDGHILIFKTGMTDTESRRDIIDKLGDDYYRVLEKIWDKIDQGDDEIKMLNVARIAAKRPEDGGVGLYLSPLAPYVLPELIRSEKYFEVDEVTADEIFEQYRSKPKWELRIEAYEMYNQYEYTQTEIAKILSERHNKKITQGYVSESVSKVKELLKK